MTFHTKLTFTLKHLHEIGPACLFFDCISLQRINVVFLSEILLNVLKCVLGCVYSRLVGSVWVVFDIIILMKLKGSLSV
jgi:hypothetical protein